MKGLLTALCVISTLLILFVGACPLLAGGEWVAIPVYLALVAWNPLLLLLLRNARRNLFTMTVLTVAAGIDVFAAVVCAQQACSGLSAQKGYLSMDIVGLFMLAVVVGFKGIATIACVVRGPNTAKREPSSTCEPSKDVSS